ncbi:MAG TPA: hypothetical protein VGV86_11360 [Acidimicrobiales bacterium]|nr:hypothetical protein [Acidimicrobiales bacterium]
MRTGKYKIVYAATDSDQAWAEEVEAEQIGHVHDGSLAWINFLDQAGEVLRVRSDSVERVERVR